MSWISAPGVRRVQWKITEHVCKCTFTRRLLRMMRSLSTWNISLPSVWTEVMMTEHLDWRFIHTFLPAVVGEVPCSRGVQVLLPSAVWKKTNISWVLICLFEGSRFSRKPQRTWCMSMYTVLSFTWMHCSLNALCPLPRAGHKGWSGSQMFHLICQIQF